MSGRFGYQESGIRIRVTGGRRETRGSAKVQIATGSLCKGAKVEARDERGERQEAVQRWKGDEAGVGCQATGFGCQVTGVRRIRVTGVGCSGDGRRGRRGSGKVQTCKRAKVEGIRGRVDKWDGGQGEARDSAKVQI